MPPRGTGSLGISQFMWVKVHSLNGRRMIRSPCRSHQDGGRTAAGTGRSVVLVMSGSAFVVRLELLTQGRAGAVVVSFQVAVHDPEDRHADEVSGRVVA